jgi:hypothetical protein
MTTATNFPVMHYAFPGPLTALHPSLDHTNIEGTRSPGPPETSTSSVECSEDVVGGVEVGEDVLHVVRVLERVDQAYDPGGTGCVDLHGD